MRAVPLCLLVAVLAAPASAPAATLTKSGNALTYGAAADRVNLVTFGVPDPNAPTTIRVSRAAGDNDTILASGCTPAGVGEFSCPGISRIVVDTGDRDDTIIATAFTGALQANGATGSDLVRGGSGADSLTGADGDDILDGGGGNDTVDGGAGDDQLDGGLGTDTLVGGSGIDSGFYGATAATPAPRVSLDGVADDGVPGENDNYGADIEDATILGAGVNVVPAASTLVGNAAANVLTTDAGNDTIVGGAGNDSVVAAAGDDAVDVRDGFADRVHCGPGTDAVTADTLDVVGADCETAAVADVGNANEDRPPTIAWTAPAAGAQLRAATPNTLQVNAADDRGVALVRFLDDDRMVCEDSAAPYTCAYQARGADVGRNTLTAIAVDGSGQTASAQRAVTVSRFRAALTLAVRPRGSTFTAGGGLARPATVPRSQACSGTVTVRVKAGSRTLATRRARLTSRCTYSIRNMRPGRSTRLRFTAAFAGNAYILPRSRSAIPTKR